jgi:hypothetical protein
MPTNTNTICTPSFTLPFHSKLPLQTRSSRKYNAPKTNPLFCNKHPQKKEEKKQKKHLRRLISEPHVPSPPHKSPRALLLDTFKPPTAKESQFPQTKACIFLSQSKQTSWKKKNNNNKKKKEKANNPTKNTDKQRRNQNPENTKLYTRERR